MRDRNLLKGYETDVTYYWHTMPGFVYNCMTWCDTHVTHAWNIQSGTDPLHVGRDTMCVIFQDQSDQILFEWSYLTLVHQALD